MGDRIMIRTSGWRGVLYCAVFWMWYRRCNQEHIAAVATFRKHTQTIRQERDQLQRMEELEGDTNR